MNDLDENRQPSALPDEGPVHEAIAALKLASQCGGELDLPIYAQALSRLEAMRDAIRAHDDRLNLSDDPQPPAGDDYNHVLSILGLV